MKMTTFVTIGRNVGNEPMSRADWMNFRRNTRVILETAGVNLVQRPHECMDESQVGTWQGVGTEQAAAFVGLLECETLVPLSRIREQLAELASIYKQEAIGFAVAMGHDNLTYAKKP